VTLLERVVARLEARGVQSALIGAAALAAAGVARSTFDIDLMVSDVAVLRDDFWTPLREAGAAVDVRRGDADDPLAGVVRLDLPGERPVDVVVSKHAWQARAIQRAVPARGGPAIVTPLDLVLLKLFAGGAQDFWDIRELLATAHGAYLRRDVEVALESLPQPMRDAWQSVGS
jgi:hypothetical protein